MTAQILARAAYAGPSVATRTARDIEYDAFARSTHRLGHAAADPDAGFSALAQAIHDNRSLWTALAIDVADEGNALPGPLRAQIFYLAEFTVAHSQKVLAGQADVKALIDINTAVMRGLRGDETAR